MLKPTLPGSREYKHFPRLTWIGSRPLIIWSGCPHYRDEPCREYTPRYWGSYEWSKTWYDCRQCNRSYDSTDDAKDCFANHHGTVGAFIARLQEIPTDWIMEGSYSKSGHTQYGIGVHAPDYSFHASIPTTVHGEIKRYERVERGKYRPVKKRKT